MRGLTKMLGREWYIPKNAERLTVPDCVAVECYLAPISTDKWHLVCFGGKRTIPDANYTFRSREAAEKYFGEYLDGQLKTAQMKAEWKAKRMEGKCHTPLDVWEKARKGEYITAAEVAICLRAELARRFPGTVFSVRSESSLNVSWTDGPSWQDVRRTAERYSFEGFDGMIDLRYSIQRWLSRDGSMTLAHSEGTEGSMGSDPEAVGDPHSGDAVLCRSTCDFVFCTRHESKQSASV